MLVSLIASAGAAIALWICAKLLERLTGQMHLVDVLRWAAMSAGATILLECARGFFVGQRRLAALLALSLAVGGGLLLLLPLAAHQHNAKRMILSQGCVTLGAVALCMVLARQLGLVSRTSEIGTDRFSTLLRKVWAFGLMQLAGLVGTNIAGWWLLTLVARADTTLAQVGFFSIASQLRNIVGIAPGLLTEGSLAVMADPEGEAQRTPQQVLGYVTFASLVVAFAMSSTGILLLPWLLRVFYSSAYAHAAPAAAIGLALAVMHMGNAPASARLSVLSVRSSGMINALWAIFVAVAGTCLLGRGVGATAAMVVFLGAHTLSSALVLCMLARKDSLPDGMAGCFAFTTAASVMLAWSAALRDAYPQYAAQFTAGMATGILFCIACLVVIGRRSRWLPTKNAWMRVMNDIGVSAQQLYRRRSDAV